MSVMLCSFTNNVVILEYNYYVLNIELRTFTLLKATVTSVAFEDCYVTSTYEERYKNNAVVNSVRSVR